MENYEEKYKKFAPSEEFLKKFAGYSVGLNSKPEGRSDVVITTVVTEKKGKHSLSTEEKKDAKLV